MELDVGLNICGKVIRAYTNCMPIIMLNAPSGGKWKRGAVKRTWPLLWISQSCRNRSPEGDAGRYT